MTRPAPRPIRLAGLAAREIAELANERAEIRRSVGIRAWVQNTRVGWLREGTVIDLSPDGVRLGLDARIAKGDELQLAFVPPRWPGEREIVLRGKVVHVDLALGSEREIGVQFVEVPDMLREQLVSSLMDAPPRLPPEALLGDDELELMYSGDHSRRAERKRE
jgi:hypothetical protein